MKDWLFGKINFYLFGACAVLLVLAYVLLAQGPHDNPLSLSVAPAILVFVYCLLIPFALFYVGGSKSGEDGKK